MGRLGRGVILQIAISPSGDTLFWQKWQAEQAQKQHEAATWDAKTEFWQQWAAGQEMADYWVQYWQDMAASAEAADNGFSIGSLIPDEVEHTVSDVAKTLGVKDELETVVILHRERDFAF